MFSEGKSPYENQKAASNLEVGYKLDRSIVMTMN